MIPIVRVYETESQLQNAVRKLKDEDIGISDAFLWVKTPVPTNVVEGSQVWDAGMPFVYKKFFDGHVQKGRSVLAVESPYGVGSRIATILDSFNPIEAELPEHKPVRAAPLSDYLGLPVLSHKPPKARLITTAPDRSFGFGLLSSNPAPLSSMLRMKVLSSKGMGNSSFGLPLLSKPKASWNTSFGLPLLTRGKGAR